MCDFKFEYINGAMVWTRVLLLSYEYLMFNKIKEISVKLIHKSILCPAKIDLTKRLTTDVNVTCSLCFGDFCFVLKNRGKSGQTANYFAPPPCWHTPRCSLHRLTQPQRSSLIPANTKEQTVTKNKTTQSRGILKYDWIISFICRFKDVCVCVCVCVCRGWGHVKAPRAPAVLMTSSL